MTKLRWFGNLLIIVGYSILLYYDLKVGLSFKFIGGILVIPSFIQLKMWDALFIVSFFTIVEGAKLLQLYFVK
jgi:hypothetical protein